MLLLAVAMESSNLSNHWLH